MKLLLAYYGDPILRKKAAPLEAIDNEIRQLVVDMEETMEANHGVGLAAPQIHKSIALFITKIPQYKEDDTVIPGKLRIFINPKIIAYSQEEWVCNEGCLSIPGIRGDVARPFKVTIQAMNLEGETFTEEFEEYDAHVIMHENDHLNGVLYIDRLPTKQKKAIEPRLREVKNKYHSK